jgi:RimJ/RimL family protein N-acetyltransferase
MIQSPPELVSDRLILRRWRDTDIPVFADINADPAVMRYFPHSLTEKETEDLVLRIDAGFDLNNFGLWAAELRDTHEFMGFIGLSRPTFESPFTPCVEVGWRLARKHWGRGYASEGARAALRDGFTRLALREIVSFTSVHNIPSIAVMKRVGISADEAGSFLHPALDPEHWLALHVLYRLAVDDWRRTI